MTIAAQFFASVFPILILLATWVGAAGSDEIAEAVDMPDESRSVLDQAVQTSGSATLGIVGTLVVLVSATSLSRAGAHSVVRGHLAPAQAEEQPQVGVVSFCALLTAVVGQVVAEDPGWLGKRIRGHAHPD
jgi:hypothetical protein